MPVVTRTFSYLQEFTYLKSLIDNDSAAELDAYLRPGGPGNNIDMNAFEYPGVDARPTKIEFSGNFLTYILANKKHSDTAKIILKHTNIDVTTKDNQNNSALGLAIARDRISTTVCKLILNQLSKRGLQVSNADLKLADAKRIRASGNGVNVEGEAVYRLMLEHNTNPSATSAHEIINRKRNLTAQTIDSSSSNHKQQYMTLPSAPFFMQPDMGSGYAISYTSQSYAPQYNSSFTQVFPQSYTPNIIPPPMLSFAPPPLMFSHVPPSIGADPLIIIRLASQKFEAHLTKRVQLMRELLAVKPEFDAEFQHLQSLTGCLRLQDICHQYSAHISPRFSALAEEQSNMLRELINEEAQNRSQAPKYFPGYNGI